MPLSICFEVRPVMIAPADPPNYSLLVGVDYTQDPVKIIDSGESGRPGCDSLYGFLYFGDNSREFRDF